ncbi:MAG: nucleotidyltransferase domain-containing protein, partial [Chlamydiales bacterium]
NIAFTLNETAARYDDLRLLLLFGSRSRNQAGTDSDWDFGYIANQEFDSGPLYTDIVLKLKTEKIDLVDLSHANGLLRFRAAQDGYLIYETPSGEYEKFWTAAVHFWCDAGPLIRAEYEVILERLG